VKRVVRRSVFESNSSSSHSITIAPKGNFIEKPYGYKDKSVILRGGKFGWGIETIGDWEGKANYCAVEFQDDDEVREVLEELIKEQTECYCVVFDFTDSYSGPNWSYIDHQSRGTVRNLIGTEKEALRTFIFGDAKLLIDNDNH
jgi:hypothetical protein